MDASDIVVASKTNPGLVARGRLRGSRQRQYIVRLRLPLEICLSVAKKLAELFCTKQDQIPTAGKLVMCKVWLGLLCLNRF